MPRRRLLGALVVVLLAAGCAGWPGSPPPSGRSSRHAPIGERSGAGVVKYLNTGADAAVTARREDAYRQMDEACRGRYRIEREGPREEGGIVMPVGRSAFLAGLQYWYIQFSCGE